MIEGEEGEIEKERLMEGVRLKLMKLIKLIKLKLMKLMELIKLIKLIKLWSGGAPDLNSYTHIGCIIFSFAFVCFLILLCLYHNNKLAIPFPSIDRLPIIL